MIRPLNRTSFLLLATALLGACKENLSAPPTRNLGRDTVGPKIVLRPGRDTTVDSTGTLIVSVLASDRSGIRQVDFLMVPAAFGFPSQAPLDTVYGAGYTIPLTPFKHSTFRFYVYARDVLDHETITDTVVVTVR